MTLSPELGVIGISTLWHFRLPLPIQMFIKVASSPRLSGIGMPSPILWSHPLKMQRIVLLSSLLWWELGTNSQITGPGEWLSFRRFTSKLSWSWSWPSVPVVILEVTETGSHRCWHSRRVPRGCNCWGVWSLAETTLESCVLPKFNNFQTLVFWNQSSADCDFGEMRPIF